MHSIVCLVVSFVMCAGVCVVACFIVVYSEPSFLSIHLQTYILKFHFLLFLFPVFVCFKGYLL